jgi:hypothetical protein
MMLPPWFPLTHTHPVGMRVHVWRALCICMCGVRCRCGGDSGVRANRDSHHLLCLLTVGPRHHGARAFAHTECSDDGMQSSVEPVPPHDARSQLVFVGRGELQRTARHQSC